MARSSHNVVVHNLSGKVGDLLVFRQRHGKTFVRKYPVPPGPFGKFRCSVLDMYCQSNDFHTALGEHPICFLPTI
jgi:hypothetical protein